MTLREQIKITSKLCLKRKEITLLTNRPNITRDRGNSMLRPKPPSDTVSKR